MNADGGTNIAGEKHKGRNARSAAEVDENNGQKRQPTKIPKRRRHI